MCTVMVIQYHCGETVSTHLGVGKEHSPVRRGAPSCTPPGRSSAIILFDVF